MVFLLPPLEQWTLGLLFPTEFTARGESLTLGHALYEYHRVSSKGTVTLRIRTEYTVFEEYTVLPGYSFLKINCTTVQVQAPLLFLSWLREAILGILARTH